MEVTIEMAISSDGLRFEFDNKFGSHNIRYSGPEAKQELFRFIGIDKATNEVTYGVFANNETWRQPSIKRMALSKFEEKVSNKGLVCINGKYLVGVGFTPSSKVVKNYLNRLGTLKIKSNFKFLVHKDGRVEARIDVDNGNVDALDVPNFVSILGMRVKREVKQRTRSANPEKTYIYRALHLDSIRLPDTLVEMNEFCLSDVYIENTLISTKADNYTNSLEAIDTDRFFDVAFASHNTLIEPKTRFQARDKERFMQLMRWRFRYGKSFKLPRNVRRIKPNAFNNFSSRSVVLNEGIESFNIAALSNSRVNQIFFSGNTTLYNSTHSPVPIAINMDFVYSGDYRHSTLDLSELEVTHRIRVLMTSPHTERIKCNKFNTCIKSLFLLANSDVKVDGDVGYIEGRNGNYDYSSVIFSSNPKSTLTLNRDLVRKFNTARTKGEPEMNRLCFMNSRHRLHDKVNLSRNLALEFKPLSDGMFVDTVRLMIPSAMYNSINDYCCITRSAIHI